MNATTYPETPGFKEQNATSEAAARKVECRVEKLRRLIKEAIAAHGPLTTDEAAEILGETPFSIRPRFTELYRFGEVEKSGQTRRNASGHPARVWRLVAKQQSFNLVYDN